MKLRFDIEGKSQPDPFVFEDKGRFYMYVTGAEGVEAYSATDPFGVWHYEGIVTDLEGARDFWAPSVIRCGGKYYMYVSCRRGSDYQFMQALSSDSPLGPFGNAKGLYGEFSIDSHAVETEDGLFLFLAMNKREGDRHGTRVFVDRLLDPYTPEGCPKEIIPPSFDEEQFTPQCTQDYKWHTVEGPFWLYEDGYHYIMYSGGCYQDDTYHVGFAYAKSDSKDLTCIEFTKYTNGDKFAPILIKNETEEGTGHNSVIKYKGEYYAFYHGRDTDSVKGYDEDYVEQRTARCCRLIIKDGRITAER